jgi:acetyl-CoA carboxylase biotin carboxyl carrier protein
MKLSKIQELLRLVADSGVSEVEIEEDDFKLTIRQNSPQVVMQPAQQYPAQMAYGPPQQAPPQQAPPQQPPPQQAPPQQPAAPQQGAPAASSASGGAASAPADGSAPEAASAAEPADNGTAEADTEETAAEDYVVKAPIVGTFYEAPSPEDDPYVEVGDSVGEGDVLCIIEAMKLMNEIECETSGTIKEVLVEDAEPVEFDQPLFVIAED